MRGGIVSSRREAQRPRASRAKKQRRGALTAQVHFALLATLGDLLAVGETLEEVLNDAAKVEVVALVLLEVVGVALHNRMNTRTSTFCAVQHALNIWSVFH